MDLTGNGLKIRPGNPGCPEQFSGNSCQQTINGYEGDFI